MKKIVKMTRTCFACPAQWDGWDEDGVYFYFRYRYGYLRVDKSPDQEGESETVFEGEFGDKYDGHMSFEDLKTHLKDSFTLPDFEDFSDA